MTNEEILKKAIEKATKNGFDGKRILVCFEVFRRLMNGTLSHDRTLEEAAVEGGVIYDNPNTILFNHDFAKAFWGENKIIEENDIPIKKIMGWQYHLQQMVLEEDPIKYLEKFL